ncbi:MAG: hypothetical protein WCO78_02505 [Candidatus Roizmanbacteria bacterium]
MKYIYLSLSIAIVACIASVTAVPSVFASPGEAKGIVKVCLAGQTWTTCSKDITPEVNGEIYVRRVEYGRPDSSLSTQWQDNSNIYVRVDKINGAYTMSNWENNFVSPSQRRSVSAHNDFMCTVFTSTENGSPKEPSTGDASENWCGFSSETGGYMLRTSFSTDFSLPQKYLDAGYSHLKGHWKIMNNQGSFVDRETYNTRDSSDRRVGDGGSITNYHFMFVLDPPGANPTSTPSPTHTPAAATTLQPTPTSEVVPVSAASTGFECPLDYPRPKNIFTPKSSVDIADSVRVNDPLVDPPGALGKPIILTSGNCSVKGTVVTAGSEEGQCRYTATWTTNDPAYSPSSITCSGTLSIQNPPIPACSAPSGNPKTIFAGDSFEVQKGSAINIIGQPKISASPSTVCSYNSETNKIKVSPDILGGESCTFKSTWTSVKFATQETVSCDTTFTVSSPIRTIKLKPVLACAEGLTSRPGNLSLGFDKKIVTRGPDKDGVYSVDLHDKESIKVMEARSGNTLMAISKTSQTDFSYTDAKDTSIRTIEVTTDNAAICVPGVKNILIKPIFGCANGKVMTASPSVEFSGAQPTSNTPDNLGYYHVTLTPDDPAVTVTSSLSGIVLVPSDANIFNHSSAIAPFEYTVRFASTNANICGSAPVRSTCRAEKCVNANQAPIINTPHTLAEGLRKNLARDKIHPLIVQPYLDPGDLNESHARSFTLTNAGKSSDLVNDKKVYIKYFLDCFSDDGNTSTKNWLSQLPCQDKKGEVTLDPYQDVTLGLGAVCSEWQLSVRYSYDPKDPVLSQDFTKQSPGDTALITRMVARDENKCSQCSSFRCVPVAGDEPSSCDSDTTCAISAKPMITFNLPPSVCEYDPSQVKIPGSVTLAEGTTARLKLGYKIIAPDNLRTDEVITSFTGSDMRNGSPFVYEVQWPGIRAIDSFIDVRVSGYLYDIQTDLPLLAHPINVHLTWKPSGNCPKPEAKVPSLSHRKTITNIRKEKGDGEHYIISYTGYVLNDGNVPINQIRLEELIKTPNIEVIYILTTDPSTSSGSQLTIDSHVLSPGRAIGYTAVVRADTLEMNQICTEQKSTGIYEGSLVSPDPSASCTNIISSTGDKSTFSANGQRILVAKRNIGEVQGVSDTITSLPQIDVKTRAIVLFTIGCGLLLAAVAVEESRIHTRIHRS